MTQDGSIVGLPREEEDARGESHRSDRQTDTRDRRNSESSIWDAGDEIKLS